MAPTILTPPSCILFDLDGTLVDSVEDITASANVVRVGLGMDPLPLEEIARYVGDGATMLIRRALAGRRESPDPPSGIDIRAAMKAFRSHYAAHCLVHTKPFPGVVETLAALAPLPMAIVSNKPQEMCDTVADGLGLRSSIRVVVGARRGVPVKPDPALLEIGLSELGMEGVAPASVWMIGDSPNDVLAGRAIGAVPMAVSWGLTPVDSLRALEPARLLGSVGELVGLVAG